MKPTPDLRKAPGLSPATLIRATRDLAAGAAVDAGGGADEFALAFAFDAGEADDLAGMHHQIDLIEAAAAQPGDLEQRCTDHLRLGRENLAERPAGDQRDDLGWR